MAECSAKCGEILSNWRQSIAKLILAVTVSSSYNVTPRMHLNAAENPLLIAKILLTLLLTVAVATPAISADLFANPRPDPLIGGSGDFLPVARAFQVNASLDGSVLSLSWQIAPGYYLYQNQFRAFQPGENRSEISVPQQFEPGIEKYDDYYEQDLVVYYDSTTVRLTLPSSTGVSELRIVSQGCADAGLCYPPRSQYLKADFESGVIQISDAPTASWSTGRADRSSTLPQPPPGLSPLPLILLFALLGGLVLNLMPCVFPVLSIKAVGLAAAHLGAHRRHSHGLAYTAGILCTFTVVAALLLVLRATGQAIGWGFQLQSPLFVTYLAYLFFLMGLGFSGVLKLGQGLMGVGQDLARGHGITSSFATGILATVVASPCTAPFMGTALGFALTQPPLVALLVFLFLGLGMALPFLILSWWPALGRKIPPPGPWMETLQQLLAFPLYLSCVWLLWVLGRQTDSDTLALAATGLVLLAFGAWLRQRHSRLSTSLAALVLLASLALPVVQRQPETEHPFWEPYSGPRLQELRQQGRAVFVNLTADWCITCLANEKLALSSATFRRALADHNVTYLRGDWTNNNPEITELLEHFQRSGVPLYLFFAADGSEPQVLPQLLTESLVTRIISD